MRSIHRVLTLFTLTTLLVAACGGESTQNPAEEPTGSVSQALYTGPALKMPLPAGYRWRLNTEAGDLSDWGHQDKSYYSLDFGRHVQDNNGKVITIANPDGSGTPDPNVTIDVLAAAGGTILDTTTIVNGVNAPGPYPLVTTDCANDPFPNCTFAPQRRACQVNIDHGGGYVTKYLHFKADTIKLVKGQWVPQGSFLGKMGNTGCSSGAHVHFQVLYNGSSAKENNPGLDEVSLEGRRFDDHQVGSFYPSTNGFAYRSDQAYGANPRVCKNGLMLQNGDYTCIQQSTFQTYRPVYSDLRIDEVQKDACYNVEYWRNNQYYTGMSVGCTNGAAGNSWYLPLPAFYTAQPGSYEARYFVSTKDRLVFLPAPMAVAKFTMLGQSNQPPPTKVSPAPGAIIHLADSLRWNDAAPYQVTDHDLFFWVWNWDTSSWKPFGFIYSWASSPYPVAKAGLPTNRWIGWVVRSCTDNVGCSGWSQFTYFGLLP